MKYLLTHGHLVIDGNREFLDGALLIENDRIAQVYPQSDKVKDVDDAMIIDLQSKVVMPGYFDTHCHGSNGLCFDNIDNSQLKQIAKCFAFDGTTSFLASISYDLNVEQMNNQLIEFEQYEDTEYARFVGIHLEGPFLSPKHTGAGSKEKFLNPVLDIAKKFLECSSKIKQMTVAYELQGAKQLGQYLQDNGIKVMCGHSDALYNDLDENVDGFTHLFNAMRPLHHRDMTLVNCAFLNKWYCELIGDGKHIDKNVLRLVLNNIDKDKIILVSDSSIARNMPDGKYMFLSKECIKKDNTFINSENHLAGSVVSINDEMKVLYELGAKYTDLLLYSSLNAFRLYGLANEFGTLEKGKYADIVISDENLNIQNVFVRGNFINV